MSVFDDLASEYTDEEVAATLAELQSWLAEVRPELDPGDVVIHSVLLAPLAVMLTKQRRLVEVTRSYGSLSALPSQSLASSQLEELRTLQAQAFGLSLGSGGFATGDVKLTFSSDESLVIRPQTVFSAGSVQFATTQYAQLLPASQYTGDAEQRKFQSDGSGRYWVTLSLTALQAGTAGNIAAGSSLSAEATIPRLQAAVAQTSFVGGTLPTDLATLISDALDGLVAKTMGSRDQVVALIRQQPEFSNLSFFGVVGSGDPEMQRDKVGIIPLGVGRTDIYAAASGYPISRRIVVEAVAGPVEGATQKLTAALGREAAPGFYRLTGPTLPSGKELVIERVERGLDTSGLYDEQVPRIETISHGTFSRFQTATLVVSGGKDDIGLAEGQKVNLELTAVMLPNIDQLQSFVASRQRRYPGGDTLVRAAVPLFLQVIVNLHSEVDEVSLDLGAITERLTGYLQSRPLRTIIYASELIAAVADLLDDKLYVSGIDYIGTLVRPDGSEQKLGGSWDFIPTFDPKDQLSPRTVAIYTSSADVRLHISRVLQAEVP